MVDECLIVLMLLLGPAASVGDDRVVNVSAGDTWQPRCPTRDSVVSRPVDLSIFLLSEPSHSTQLTD